MKVSASNSTPIPGFGALQNFKISIFDNIFANYAQPRPPIFGTRGSWGSFLGPNRSQKLYFYVLKCFRKKYFLTKSDPILRGGVRNIRFPTVHVHLRKDACPWCTSFGFIFVPNFLAPLLSALLVTTTVQWVFFWVNNAISSSPDEEVMSCSFFLIFENPANGTYTFQWLSFWIPNLGLHITFL